MPTPLSPGVLYAISVIERIGSVFSLLGCVFIIVTFTASTAFRKPINRLVFYASFGNMLTNVATLIARAYTDSVNSAGCQLQGFLIQQFMPADALWTLAMAFNVYLTFYHKFDAQKLKMMEIWYLLFCYGLPLAPALGFIFISTAERGRIYGDATLWCWVAPQWEVLRIATFYGPVWLVIAATFFIYIRAGREIYKKRRQLRALGNSSSHHSRSAAHDLDPDTAAGDVPYSTKTTEITVTTESADEYQLQTRGGSGGVEVDLRRAHSVKAGPEPDSPSHSQLPGAYSITISSDRHHQTNQDLSSSSSAAAPTKGKPKQVTHNPNHHHNPGNQNHNHNHNHNRHNREAGRAAWSYTKCAILFFTALLVTWIPSSANRVYSAVHGNDTVVVLQILSAIVLPLQGFWNAIIYSVTSWTAVKLFFSELLHHRQAVTDDGGGVSLSRRPHILNNSERRNLSMNFGGVGSGNGKNADGDSDSMVDLAGHARSISRSS